ncbi:hypothetical protein CI610_01552 [invertebrate metagenome]|uniref:DUF4404 family protein n=1 Tax=invertebrate metagenome TaxID=1711999 RepID=A0A2H9T8D1_9ZZZZ
MSQEIQIRLQKLHDMLKGQPADKCTEGTLNQVSDEIKIALEQAKGNIPVETFNEQLEKEAIRLEDEYPTLAKMVREIMDLLNNIGV